MAFEQLLLQQAVGLAAALVGREVDRVDRLLRHETENLHDMARAFFQGLQFFFREQHKGPLVHLVSLLHIRTLDFLSCALRDVLLLDA
jgi:hypothetical protein